MEMAESSKKYQCGQFKKKVIESGKKDGLKEKHKL